MNRRDFFKTAAVSVAAVIGVRTVSADPVEPIVRTYGVSVAERALQDSRELYREQVSVAWRKMQDRIVMDEMWEKR